MLAQSVWREDPLVAVDRQFRIGVFFASPAVMNGVVYVGATDGYLYAM